MARQRARAREHDRARGGAYDRAAAHEPHRLADERDRDAGDGRDSLTQAAPEPRMGRARDHAARARTGARREKRRGRIDGDQPAGAQPLPRQIPDGHLIGAGYADRNYLRSPSPELAGNPRDGWT